MTKHGSIQKLNNSRKVQASLRQHFGLVLTQVGDLNRTSNSVKIDRCVQVFRSHCDACARTCTLDEFSFLDASEASLEKRMESVLGCEQQRQTMTKEERYQMFALLFAEAFLKHAFSADNTRMLQVSARVQLSLVEGRKVPELSEVFGVLQSFVSVLDTNRRNRQPVFFFL